VSWQLHAHCLEAPPELFFVPDNEDEAKALCDVCSVREECLGYALDTRQDHGVWGGKNEQERVQLLLQAIPGGPELEEVTYTTRARSTGAVCSAGRTATGWGTVCETHDVRATTRNRTAAERAVSRPEEWCFGCSG